MNKKKVSAIIPAYNVENCIEGCINSILNQTYSSLEIIIVDDGSSDATLSIVETIKRNNHNKDICVLSQNNGGVSSARNVGIGASTGDYLVFIDADDSICKNYIEMLVDVLETENSEIVACKPVFVKTIDERDALAKETVETKNFITLAGEEALHLFLNDCLSGSSCEKIFSKRCVDDIRFLLGVVNNEDKLYTFQALTRAKRVTLLDTAGYICYERIGSASRSTKTFNMDSMTVSEIIRDTSFELYCNNYKICMDAKKYYLRAAIYAARTLIRSKIVRADKMNYYKTIVEMIRQEYGNKLDMRFELEKFVIKLGFYPYTVFVTIADCLLKR